MPRKKKNEVIEEKKESPLETSETLVSDSAQKLQKLKISDSSQNSKRILKSGISDKTSEKTEKKEEVSETPKKPEEFPDLEIGIDVFASPSNVEHTKEEKIKEIQEKAKKLAEKIEGEEKITEELKKSRRAEKTLFPLDDYVKYSAHLGTKAITPNMRQYVYKRRADGLAVLNTNSIDEKLKEGCEFLAKFNPEDIFLACKREAGWPAAKKFSEVTGIKVFTKKYPAGIITNINLSDFFETELVIVCDPWLDKNALNDAIIIKKPVIALCDTNNLTNGATKVVPCNNKAGKSLGLILYLMAREYLKLRGKEKEAKSLNLEDFAGRIEESPVREPKEDREGRIIEEKVSQAVKEGV